MKTLVIGASEKEERYSNQAIKRLLEAQHEVKAIGLRKGNVNGVDFDTEKIAYKDIHTVTLYVGVKRQDEYYDYIESLKPKRVIFNPGTENKEWQERLEEKGIEALEACTLVLLRTNQF